MYVKQWNPPIYQVIWQLNYAKILYWAYYIAQKHYLTEISMKSKWHDMIPFIQRLCWKKKVR